MEKLSIKASIAYGWKTFWSRPWLFVLTGIVAFAVNTVASIPEGIVDSIPEGDGGSMVGLLSLVFSLISIVVSIYVQMGTVHFSLKAHDDVTSARIRDLVMLKGFWRFLGANALVFLAVIAGLILLVVPGVILALALVFVTYLVVDKGLGPVSSFKESMAITKGNRWNLFVFCLALCGLNLLGLLALVVGLAVTIPVSMIASVHAYRLLSGSHMPVITAEAPGEPVVAAA